MKDDSGHSLSNFIKYNNTVPIVLGVLFFMTTGAFAASPEVRSSIYSSSTSIQSVDTSYIASVNLDTYPFAMRVVGVTEDDEKYYVTYQFDTIDVVDGVWRDVTDADVLKVSKALLAGGDLKAYVGTELAQLRSHELDRLKETQAKAQKTGVSSKVVATEYSGLVGKLMTGSEEVVPQFVSQVSPTDPLAVQNPQPLVTWDQNAPRASGDNPSAPADDVRVVDVCPDMPGIQVGADASACVLQSVGTPGGTTTTTSPPPSPSPDTASTTTNTSSEPPPPPDTQTPPASDTGSTTDASSSNPTTP